ncbi:MAG: leukotoxin LktA family filamentous adhesin, partial [Phycisphaerae bacterium]
MAASAAAGLFGSGVIAVAIPAGVNDIVPDGRTLTTVNITGHTTTISTATISGGDAFNSFQNFAIGSGNTVDLVVPTAANYLVNLVHDGPVVINGILNSYKNGQIGGNVVFADPQGVLVGSSGVVNVGAINFTTPTTQFLNQLINQAGQVDRNAAAQLLSGTEPLSGAGVVSIAGHINALTSINLAAAEVIAAKSSVLTAGDSARLQNALFHATVNTTGLQQGAALAESNGSIAIVGTQQVDLAGRVQASGTKGGSITATAPNTVLDSTATLDASGANGGGTVLLGGNFHGQGSLPQATNVTVNSGATILANALVQGNGGQVALWSAQGTKFEGSIEANGGTDSGNGGYVEVSSPVGFVFNGHVNTSAAHGLTGTLLLDPTNLYIVNGNSGSGTEDSSVSSGTLPFAAADGSPASTISVGELQSLGDTNITLEATDAITIGDSSGNSADLNLATDTTPLKTGTLTLEAGTTGAGNITFNTGSSIETDGGAVVLDAGAGFTGSGAYNSTGTFGTAALGAITTHGGSVTVNAANNISLPASTAINTTGTGVAGAIDFEGGQTLNSGIDVNNSQTGVITIDGTLDGGNITLDENSTANSVYTSGVTGFASFGSTNVVGSILGLAGQGVLATVNSTVNISGTATITGTNVEIESQNTEEASSPEYNVSLTSFNPFPSSILYGQIGGIATSTVAKGATININTGGSLTVSAENNDTLNLSAYTVTTTNSTYTAATVAVGYANINSTATIASGANISLGANSNVSVLAHNQNSFSVSATAMANSSGVVGIAAAISDITTNATAAEDASLGTSTQKAGNVTVVGDNITSQEETSASGSAGSSFVIKTALSAASSATSALGTKLSSMLGSTGGEGGGSSASEGGSSTTPFRVGAAMGLALVSQGSYAQIANDDGVNTDTPTIDSSGNVLVHAATNTAGIRNDSQSAVNSETNESDADPTNPANQVGVSVGIGVGIYHQATHADIGDNVQVTAANVGVSAISNIPATITWTQWDSFSTVLSHLNGTLGTAGDVLTSYANASGNATDLSIAGAVNFFDVYNNTQAWIGTGAKVTSTATGETSSVSGSTDTPAWTVALGWDENALDYQPGGTVADSTLNFNDPIIVNAYNFTQTIDVGGNFSILLNGTNAGSSGTGVGGAFNGILYNNTTDAAIGSGAVVTVDNSGPGLSVTAQGVDQLVAVSPTSGYGSSVAGNGIFGFVDIENSTLASISNAADIMASQVVLDGQEDLAIWNVAGAASEGNTAGVGVGLAISYFNTDTEAFIGDNSTWTLGGETLGGTSGGGYVHAAQLAVDALTDGQAGSLAVAGGVVSSSDPNAEPGNLDNAKSWASGKLTSFQIFAANAFGKIPKIGSKIASAVGPAVSVQQQQSVPDSQTSIGVAGSFTFNVAELTTKAWVSDATLAGLNGAAINPTVQALNYTGLISASGGASLVMANNPSSTNSAGIAGAVAFDLIDNTTSAYITDSTLSDIGALNVNALTGGFEVSVGLGLAVNTSSSENNVAAAVSLSLPEDTNTTSAYIENSTVTGASGTTSSMNVTAYDQTLIGVGGGSFYGTSGEGGGAGVVFTISSINNTVSAYLDGVDATEFDTVDVQALDASQIYGGALMIGAAPSGIAINGGFVINFITDQTSASIDAYVPATGSAVDSTIDTTGDVTVNAASSSDLATSAFTASDYYYQLDPTLGEGAIGITQGSAAPTYASLLSQAGGGDPTDSNVRIAANIGGETLPNSTQNEIIGVAGFGSEGENAVGLGFIANVIDNSYTASIDNATVDATGGTVKVTATNNGTIIGAALGVAIATEGISGLGSVVGNYMQETTSATIGNADGTSGNNYATVTGTAVYVTSNNNATIWSGAGSIGFGTDGAFGASIAYNQTNDSSTAQVESATVTALENGTAQINSNSASAINSYAIAGGIATSGPAVEGAVAVNLTTDGTIAQIDNSTITAGILSTEALDPTAAILSETGTVAVGEVSVGASIGIDVIANTLQSDITGSTLNITNGTTVESDSGGSIQSLDYAGGVGENVAVGFVNSSNDISNQIAAYIIDSTGTDSGNTTTITAQDTSTIETLAAGVTGSGDVAASVATAINRISSQVNAYIEGASGETAPAITSPVLTENDVVLTASSDATIQSLAAGVAGGGDGAGVGSIAINILTNTVNAYIDDGAQVTALDNIGVEATNQNAIQDIAGGLAIGATTAAIGLSTGVNYIGSGTYAYISGPNTDVNALASDSGDTLTVQNGGTLTNGTGFQANITTLSSLADYNAPTPSENSISVTGLAVNAASLNTTSQEVFVGSFSFDPEGSAALDAQVGVSVAGGTSSAYINNAGINQTQSVTIGTATYNAGSDQEVNVTASNHDLGALFALGAAAGTTDATGAATVGVQSFNGQTNAYITGSDVNANGSLTIKSASTQDGAALSAGVAAAITGGAATAVVDDFSAATKSYLVGGNINTGALTIDANTEDSAETAGGSLALGLAGYGATILVVQSQDTTRSYLGDAADQTATTLTTPGAIKVTAESATNLNATSVNAGVGLSSFVVMASVNLINNITDADMYDTNIDQQTGNPAASSVNIQATDTMTLTSYAGALSASAADGFGAGVNVLDLTSQVGAGSYGNNMNISGPLTVNATSNKNLQAVTAVASVGTGGYDLAGAAGVVIVSAQSSDGSYGELANVQSNDSSTLAVISSMFGTGNSLLGNTNGQLTNSEQTNIGNATTTNLSLFGGMGNGTKAILSGGTIHAGSVSVTALDNTTVQNIAAAGGLGGLDGVGAGIGVTELDGTVFASIQNAWITSATTIDPTVITAPTITVTATEAPPTGDTSAVTDAYAGGVGDVQAGFGAAVAVSLDDTNVTANAGGTLTGNSGSGSYLNISATDSSTLSGKTIGVAAGGLGAVGASVTYVKKTSTVHTYILPPTAAVAPIAANPPAPAVPGVPATPAATITNFNSVTLTSTDGGSVISDATAGGVGGLIGGDAAISNATDNADVNSIVGANSTLSLGGGGLTVTATDTPDVSATAIGVAVSGGIALGASVATATISPTVQALVGNNANLTGANSLTLQANLNVPTGGDSGYASTIAGSGGELVGADATVSTATSNINIQAGTGSYVLLPAGTVAVAANSNTVLNSTSTGVAVGGILAAGAAVSKSDASGATTASMGSNNTTGINRTADLGVQANSTVTNTSNATAGSGGLLAGSAAYAQTSDTTSTTASAGANDNIYADNITVNAVHTSNYFAGSNSIEASAVGASGSYSKNTIDPITTASLGNSAALTAWNEILLNAYNHIIESSGGYSAQGAAGGIASGASVQTTTNIGDDAYVTLGTSDVLSVGTDPYANPGLIDITADDIITAADTTNLNTGGAISAAGANSSTYVTDTNTVTIGISSRLLSLGDIDIGTYAMDGIANSALVHTYGLAGGAGAIANSQITANQSVSIGNTVDMLAYGNVNIMAGRSGDGKWFSLFGPDAIAASYVRAIIPIPVVDATATVRQNNNVTFGTGGSVYSGSNTDLEAYQGSTNPQADGEGHAYILGFIPVSATDSNTSANGSGIVQLGGNFVAGYFHDLTINISNSTSAGGLDETSGAPIQYSYSAAWNPTTFVNSIQGQDPTVEAMLENSISSTDVTMFDLGNTSPLFASAGNITINATSITGSGNLTAYGNAQINITNSSPAYLVLGSTTTSGSIAMDIPPSPGGQILFTGAANTVPNAVTVSGVDPNSVPIINISSNYPNAVGTTSTPEGPAIFITGNIQNLAGDVTIADAQGSLGLFATILAQQWIADIPNGVLTASDPNSTYFSNSNPASDWASYVTIPGLSGGSYNGNVAVAYVANARFNSSGQYGGTGGSNSNGFTYSMFYVRYVDNGSSSGSYWQAFNWYSAAVVYGSGKYGNLYTSASAATYSPVNGATLVNPAGNGYRPGYYYPEVPTETLNYSYPGPLTNYPSSIVSSGSHSVFIGGQVGISAKYIDIDSNISSGQSTNWSVNIPSSINSFIQTEQNDQNILKQFGLNMPTVDLSSGSYGISALNAGDQMITPVYNPVTNEIVLDSKFTDPVTNQSILSSTINASGGGFVYLHGGIISTAPGAGIHINDGYGNVTVDNSSSVPVVVQNVSTGNGSIGEVKIVDTLASSGMPNTWWYVYQQGLGVTVYNNSNGATTPSRATVVSSSNGGTATFNPDQVLSNSSQALEYQWSESAYLSRTVTINNTGDGGYGEFNNITSAWTFLNASDGGPAGTTSTNPYTNNVATGTVVTGSNTDPLIQESITGQVTKYQNIAYTFAYSGNGFQLPDGSSVDYGNGGPGSYAEINTIYPTAATITATFTVRADNPIDISFTGNSTASVTVNSAAGIVLDGQIQNPGGATTLNASSGSITQVGGNNINILTNGLVLTAANGIGTAAQPLNATMVGGALTATNSAAGGVYLTINSPVQIGSITADNSGGTYGDVNIAAQGAITGQSGGGTVTGDNITLNSTDGGVGTTGQSLVVNANGVIQTGGTIIGGVVNSNALDSIYLSSPNGDLFVGSIVSQGGDVSLSSSGAILDASAETALETLSAAQLKQIWTALHLTADSSQNTNTVTPFNNLVANNYQLYWKLLNSGTVNGTTYTLNSSLVPLYTPLATAAGETVAQYLQNQYSVVTAFFANSTYFSNNGGETLLSQPYSPTFAYNVQTQDPTIYDNLIANDLWNQGQLENYINSAAILAANSPEPSSTGTLVGNAVPNVSGRNVTLTASSSVGTLAPAITIQESELVNGTLSNDPNYLTDAAALSLANAPGEVYINNGQVVIDQAAPLFLGVSGGLTGYVSAGPFFVQATGALVIKTVNAAGNIRIAAADSISGSGLVAGDVVGGGTLLLVAQNNDIGSAATPLTINIPGALSADAGENIYISQVGGGGLTIGEIFAGASVNLNVPNGNLLPLTSSASYGFNVPSGSTLTGTSTSTGYNTGFSIVYNIVSPVINLDVSGNIGSSTAPLQVDNGSFTAPASAPALNGTIGQAIYLEDPNTTDTLYIGTITSGELEDITAQGGLNVNSATAATGNIQLAAGINNNMGTVTAQNGDLNLTAVGNLTLATGNASGSATVASGGYLNFGTLTSGGYALLTAPGNITGTLLTTSNNSNAVITSTGGSITAGSLDIAGALTANADTTLALTTGQVGTTANLTSGTTMQIGTLKSGGTQTLKSGSDLNFGTLTSGGYAQLSAPGNITGTSLTTSNNSNAAVTSTGGSITAGSLDIAGALTANADTTLALTTGQVGTTANLTSGTTMQIGTLKSGGMQTLKSGSDLNFGTLTSGGYAQLTAPGNITGNSLTTGNNSNAAVTSTGGSITAGSLDIAGALTANADTTLALTTGQVGTTANLTSGTTMQIGTLTSGGMQTLKSGSDLNFGTLTSGGYAQLSAPGNIAGTSLTTTNNSNAAVTSTGGSITAGSLDIAGALTANADTTLALTTGQVGTTANLTSGTTMQIGTLTSGGN